MLFIFLFFLFLSETLRKHPPVWNLFRKCTASSYTFQGTELTIPKNQTVFIPILGIHHDPNIYPNPEVFDPKRFIGEDNTINNTTYIPFGRGPRSCMGKKSSIIIRKFNRSNNTNDNTILS